MPDNFSSGARHAAPLAAAALALVAALPVRADDAARIDALERSVSQMQAAQAAAATADAGLPLHGFADVGAGARNRAAEGLNGRGFNAGTLDLYLSPQISQQVKSLLEIAFEFDSEGGLAVDMERIQLGYVFSDALTLWAGRFHTPYGYWNTAFHHGQQFQTALSRPRFLDFEDKGGIVPAHSIGLWATGAAGSSAYKVHYDAYVVNGDRIADHVLDFQAAGDGDGKPGLGFRADVGLGATGLTVGVHGYRMSVSGDSTDPALVTSTMTGAYTVLDTDDWEVMAELYRFSNDDRLGGTGRHSSRAWYAQAGYNLSGTFTVYGRVERSSLDASDPYFNLQVSGVSYRRSVAGVRMNVSPKAALKLEAMSTRQDNLDGTAQSLAVQYSIRF